MVCLLVHSLDVIFYKYSLLKHSNLRYFDGKLSKLSPSEAVLQTLFLLPVLTSLLPHLIYLT